MAVLSQYLEYYGHQYWNIIALKQITVDINFITFQIKNGKADFVFNCFAPIIFKIIPKYYIN